MDLLLSLLQIPILIFLIKYIRTLHSDKLFIKAYYYLLTLKITAGFVLGYLYLFYYGYGDIVEYLKCFERLSEIANGDFYDYLKLIVYNEYNVNSSVDLPLYGQYRAFLFARFVSPLYQFTGNNFWILSIYLSLFSFYGLWILSQTLIKLFKLNSLSVLISFFIFPSVIFWSSGLLKETLIIGLIGIWLSIILNSSNNRSIDVQKIVLLILISVILLKLKFYYFSVMLIAMVPYIIINLIFDRQKEDQLNSFKLIQICLIIFLIIGVAYLVTFVNPLLNSNVLFLSVYKNYLASVKASRGLNVFIFEGLSSDPRSFIEHIPTALKNGLFGPFLWHCKKIISLLSGIENTFLLILFITFIIQNFKFSKIMKINLIEISGIIYILILAVFMAFSAPNWGTLVRYKVAYLPFFLLFLLNNNPIIIYLDKKWKTESLLEK